MQNLTTICLALVIGLFALAVPSASHADDLDKYRASGDIIERHDGYVEAGPNAPAAAKKLVKDVNSKRKKVYEARAKQNGVPASEVGKIFAKEVIARAPKGTKFRNPNGSIATK